MADAARTVAELEAHCERLQEQVAELEAEMLDDDDKDKVNVEVPVAGRTNWDADKSRTVDIERDSDSETETEAVTVPAAGRTNDATGTVERAVPVGSGMEDIEEARAEMWRRIVEDEQKRNRERQQRMNERETQSRERYPYALTDDEVEAAPDVPAGGRTNWDRWQEADE